MKFGSKSPLNKAYVFEPEPKERNTIVVQLTAGVGHTVADTKVFENIG